MRSRRGGAPVGATAGGGDGRAETVRDRIDDEARTRDRYERGFAAYVEADAPTEEGRQAAVCASVPCKRSEVVAWCAVGVPELRLPSFSERMRDASRRLVAADRRGVSLEALERKSAAELAAARAKAAADARRAEAKVLGDAVQQRAEEARLVRGVRQTATAMIAVQAPLISASMKLAQQLLDDLGSDNAPTLTPAKKVELIRNVASVVKQTAETAKIAVHVERVLLGEPTHILGTSPTNPTADMTPEEAGQYVELAVRAMKRAEARRTIIDVDAVDEADDAPTT